MSYWTTLAVVAGYGTLFLLSDNRQKRQARELPPCQKASSQFSSSSRSSLSSSPSSPLFPVSCGVFEDIKRVAAEEDQKEVELWRRFSHRRRSIRTKREKEFRPVGSDCSSSATCLPPLSSSSSCSCVIRKSAAVSPSLSSSTGGCGGSTGEKTQSPCSSCSRLQASTSVSARILSDDGSNGRENLDDGNDAKNLDDDDDDAWSLDDSNDEGNLDDDKDERNVDDDGNDGRMLEKSEAHRLTGARKMISATAAAAADTDDDDDDDDDDEVDCSKWNNSIHLDDIHLPDFVSRRQDDEWRHFGGQKVVKTRVSKDEKQFIGRDKRKSRQKRSLQNNASRKTNLLDNTKLSHETNLRHNKKPSHKTNLPNNTGPSHKTNLRNYTETSHRTNLTNNTERSRETNLQNTETQKRNFRSNKNPSHKANLPTNAESSYKTKLRDKKQQHESNLPNNKQRAKTNLPSYSEEQDIAILAKNAQPSYSATLRINAESECERNLAKNTESSAGKVAASSQNSSANDVISTSFCCNQDSEDVIHQLTDRQSIIESTALSDINCNLTKTLSCSLLINQPSVKKAGHNRKSTTTGETKDGLRDYPSGANWNSFSCSQETITNKRSRTYAAGVSDCCNCDSTDTPPKRNSRDGTPIGKNSSTGFDFERFRFYDQPVHFRHDNENANVDEADLLRRKRKTEKELCRSDVIPSREEQSMTNCTEYDSKQRSHETKEPCAEIGVVTPSASAVQSNGTKSLVRWSFMTILYWTFFILLFVLIVLYTLDYLFDLTRSKGHKRPDSEELQFSCGDQLTVSCDDKD